MRVTREKLKFQEIHMTPSQKIENFGSYRLENKMKYQTTKAILPNLFPFSIKTKENAEFVNYYIYLSSRQFKTHTIK